MKIWEITCENDSDQTYGERNCSEEYEAGYEAGIEEGWRRAMQSTYGERSVRRSGSGLSKTTYGMRGGDEYWDDSDVYAMRRARNTRGRFI